MSSTEFSVNGRSYAFSDAPVVVICIDGSEPAYHEEALAAGRMPWLSELLASRGTSWAAHCAVPTLTNPNNMSIATGRPPAVHGICGNYILDPESGEEVLMNDPKFLRAPTIFAAAAAAGLSVAVVTAKDKLSRLLAAGLTQPGLDPAGSGAMVEPINKGICFSAEKAHQATKESNGIDAVMKMVDMNLPEVYSAGLSEFVLAAGVRILQDRTPDLMFLTLTDYIQHKNAPGTETANDFYSMIDHYAAALDELGAIVVITADHGMSPKHKSDGTPQVIYLEEEVNRVLGVAGDAPEGGSRVILPITDPYTVHHGALGSFANVYLPDNANRDTVLAALEGREGISGVYRSEEAAKLFDMPLDRMGDLTVLSDKNTALGRYAAWHDLGNLEVPLRSHGGLGELNIPFFVNRILPTPTATASTAPNGDTAIAHNYDAFWVATTHASVELAEIS
ncbi:phosphonoacetate hydrolase [Arthrobacter sp. V4I6]|uniref:phosphonoacetate hydrolase n=1 Tax=unclassified Arthrobacter TaxID=235627 RepID=UPI002788253F|nr:MULTISPECIES: phosphonoacetate hydrolase [unclassified Arthrobacter]MDQ0821301.1 phosphonoacetate hydrolase [Arthrobacter sp. V1I7]MDQ0855566.1 phosphonoacetate hydrolase [Arthrobacter sp. V4I6]